MQLWVVAENDGEAVEIIRLLRQQGARVATSQQRWGATWARLEAGIKAELDGFRQRFPDGEVLGVELAGPNAWGARNIDHHKYSDEDRSHPLSSLEQVAELLGVQLDRWQTLVAANDRAYIPGMEALGATPAEIEKVRTQDRRAQGVTEQDEERARREIGEAERRGQKTLVRCAGPPASAHSDLLWGTAAEVLLVSDKEWSYTGPRHRRLAAIGFPEQHWTGGADTNGYFGIASPGEQTQREIERLFWEE